jgi:hypothetical protein
MQSTETSSSAGMANLNVGSRPSLVMVCGVLILMGAIWLHARSEGPVRVQSPSSTEAFAAPETFVVVPGGTLARINVREGPGTNYPIRMKLPRGAYVTGVRRAFDSEHAGWIELINNGGFVKETVVAPAATP